MKINIFQWRYSPLLMLLVLWLPADNAQAAEVNCTVSMPNVNLGTITPANANNEAITINLTYTCTNTVLLRRDVSICLAVDGGQGSQDTFLPRYMVNTTLASSRLAFTMTLPELGNVVWGSRNYPGTSEYKLPTERIRGGETRSFNVPIKISLYNNVSATPGIYTNNLSEGSTAMAVDISSLFNLTPNCSRKGLKPNEFPFTVQANVLKECKITANPGVISLGSEPAGEKNLSSNGKIGVTCTNTTPYTISLTPSNNATNGVGTMSGSSGNTDEIPYILRKNSGGDIWGNVADDRVAGKGDGTIKTETVYVDVPNADVTPDSYSDTVTIHVNY